MRFSTFVGAGLTAASAVSAAVVAPPANNLAERQANPTESDARARCDTRGPQDGEHVLVIMFRMHGTIDPGTGDPGIGDSAHVYLYSHNCNLLGDTDWNGGVGTVSFGFEGDRDFSFHIGNAWLSNNPPPTPTDVQVNGDEVPYVYCTQESNSGFGYATFYRICSLRWP